MIRGRSIHCYLSATMFDKQHTVTDGSLSLVLETVRYNENVSVQNRRNEITKISWIICNSAAFRASSPQMESNINQENNEHGSGYSTSE